MNKAALRAIARLAHIDIASAVQTTRHNPILDSEVHIEEELINLQESLDSYYAAGDTIHKYPQMYQHLAQERRQILKHCLGLIVRMMHGKRLPRPYHKEDVDYAVKRLVQLVVEEARRAGKRLDQKTVEIFRPYLTVRQRIALRDFGMDLLMHASQIHRAQSLAGRLQLPRLR